MGLFDKKARQNQLLKNAFIARDMVALNGNAIAKDLCFINFWEKIILDSEYEPDMGRWNFIFFEESHSASIFEK